MLLLLCSRALSYARARRALRWRDLAVRCGKSSGSPGNSRRALGVRGRLDWVGDKDLGPPLPIEASVGVDDKVVSRRISDYKSGNRRKRYQGGVLTRRSGQVRWTVSIAQPRLSKAWQFLISSALPKLWGGRRGPIRQDQHSAISTPQSVFLYTDNLSRKDHGRTNDKSLSNSFPRLPSRD